jgi:hypothetical protein
VFNAPGGCPVATPFAFCRAGLPRPASACLDFANSTFLVVAVPEPAIHVLVARSRVSLCLSYFLVMAGLDPTIHVSLLRNPGSRFARPGFR